VPAKRVLLVDDDSDGREALATLLRTWGHEVEPATTAAEMFARVPAFQPDAIVLDLTLGDEASPDYDMIRQLRDFIGSGVQVIVYSGHPNLAPRAREAGCDAYVVKPRLDALEALLGPAANGTETPGRPDRSSIGRR
jgi:CheY-like chemotaxis protein